ncbi:MAG TPA: GntR family transcriptional regulator [Candidatus Limnocylindria bacterium]|nr:GntR family transcriptional regulator [Candidatus Limnocylindria bacterium]
MGQGAKRVRVRRRPRPLKWWRQPLALKPARRGTLADRAADAIRRRIVLGRVKPGQRLEAMRELARQLNVSLGVVREAVAQLKAEGVVQVHHGRGTYVARRPAAARVLRAARRRAGRRELEELRQAVEPALAHAAAKRVRARPRDLTELHLAMLERTHARSWATSEAYTKADLEVHAAVARLSGNALGAAAYRMAAVGLRPHLVSRARDLAKDDRLHRMHEALVDAIEHGRPVRARRAAAAIAAIEGGSRAPPA